MKPLLVVSDASPLNILIRLGQVDVLALLFDSIVVPMSVAEEMSRSATPVVVRNWIANPPFWFSVKNPRMIETPGDRRHRGERDAIQLALELSADAILLDEAKPRVEASNVGLRVIGTIGLIEQAANDRYILDLSAVHDELRNTDFFVSEEILRNSLSRHLSRKR